MKVHSQKILYSAKECAYIAVFVALLIGAQLALSFLPGVEIVTVLFVAYSFTFGRSRGMLSATAFSLLRQFVFGVSPTVLILYLIYYNLLSFLFGSLGKRIQNPVKMLLLLTAVACVCTACFTLLDDIITPLWYGYSAKATRLYFLASLPVMLSQTICTAISVFVLFLPLQKAFSLFKK